MPPVLPSPVTVPLNETRVSRVPSDAKPTTPPVVTPPVTCPVTAMSAMMVFAGWATRAPRVSSPATVTSARDRYEMVAPSDFAKSPRLDAPVAVVMLLIVWLPPS